MAQVKGRVPRAGTIAFGDASLSIYEDGFTRSAGNYQAELAWERQYKREVFARIVNTLNRLGWTCTTPQDKIDRYGLPFARNHRYCVKGDLQADLDVSGRCINLDMFQNVNAPDRPDHGGRYQDKKEHHMPYVMRLEMERTRRRIRDYLLNVLTDYAFKPSDPVLGVNGATALEVAAHRRRTTGHYVAELDRARIGNRREGFSADGVALENGMLVYAIDRAGRVICGTAFYSLGGNWQIVTGRYHVVYLYHNEIFVRCPEHPRIKRNREQRRRRLEGELATAIKAMRFERAAVLRDILFPGNPALYTVWNSEHQVYHRTGFRGYTRDQSEAGKFTADEVRGWDRAPNQVIALNPGAAPVQPQLEAA
jgi:hypothetical protein